MLTHHELPDPLEFPAESDERSQAVDEYAEKTFVPREWVLKRLSDAGTNLARYYCGFPVRVRGKAWGVIVIDSTSLNMTDADDVRKIYNLYGKALGSLLTHDGILKRG